MGDSALGLVKFLAIVVVFFMAVGAFPELLSSIGNGKFAWIAIVVILVVLILGGGMTVRKNLFGGVFVTLIVVFLAYGAITRKWEELKTKPDVWSRMARNVKDLWDNSTLSDKLSFVCIFVPDAVAGDMCSRYGAGSTTQAEQARENRIECLWKAAYDADLGQPVLEVCKVHQENRSALETCMASELEKHDVLHTCRFGRTVIQPP